MLFVPCPIAELSARVILSFPLLPVDYSIFAWELEWSKLDMASGYKWWVTDSPSRRTKKETVNKQRIDIKIIIKINLRKCHALLSIFDSWDYLFRWRGVTLQCKKLTQLPEFKSWPRLFTFHIALITLGKLWIQLSSLQRHVKNKADWALYYGNWSKRREILNSKQL